MPGGCYTILLHSWDDVGRDVWDEDDKTVEAMKSYLTALLMAQRCPDIYFMRCTEAVSGDDDESLSWWTGREVEEGEFESEEEEEECDDDDNGTSESSEESMDECTQAYHKFVNGNGDGDDEPSATGEWQFLLCRASSPCE